MSGLYPRGELDGFQGLQGPNDARHDTQHACIGAPGAAGSLWGLWKHAPVAWACGRYAEVSVPLACLTGSRHEAASGTIACKVVNFVQMLACKRTH